MLRSRLLFVVLCTLLLTLALSGIPRPALAPLLVGAMFFGLQAVILVITLASFPNVTQINVVYNARGLWSVLAVWLIGHWWGNREMAGGGAVFGWRMAGAACLLGAIVLAVT